MDISPTPYSTLVSALHPKVQTLGLGKITEEEAEDIVSDYIRPACVRFKACKQNLRDRNDEFKTFNIELSEEEIEIIANFMLIEWLSSNFINVPLLLKQSMPSKDLQVFSKRNHLDGLISLREIYKQETRQMISIYSNSDSDLFSILKEMSGTTNDEDTADTDEEEIEP